MRFTVGVLIAVSMMACQVEGQDSEGPTDSDTESDTDGSPNSTSSIWLRITQNQFPDSECNSDGSTENYSTDVLVYVDDDGESPDNGWEETFVDSYLAQILSFGDGNGMLIIGDQTLPGYEVDGEWVFELYFEHTDDDHRTHEASGYDFSVVRNERFKWEYRFTMDGDTSVGAFTSTSVDEADYVETDEWETEGEGYPSYPYSDSEYSVSNQLDENTVNMPGTAECADELCEMHLVYSCTSIWPFTAEVLTEAPF